MWWAEKLSATVCALPVRFVATTLKSTVTGPPEMSYDAGLLMKPVGAAAERIPSKFGFPAAATVCEGSIAAAMGTVPAIPQRPPRRLSANPVLSMPLPLSESLLDLIHAH